MSAELIKRAKSGVAPDGWALSGGADEDMAGVLWTDAAGDTYLGVAEATGAAIPDPCTWYRQPRVGGTDFVEDAAT